MVSINIRKHYRRGRPVRKHTRNVKFHKQKKIKFKARSFFGDEEIPDEEEQAAEYSRKKHEEINRRLNDPRSADRKEIESLFFDQISDRDTRSTKKALEEDDD